MGKILLMVVLLGVSIQNYAQYGTRGVYSSESNPIIVAEETEIRDVVGGTVIIPEFQGSNFNSTIRNAFQRACRIWEEKIPTAYPLRIMVRMAQLQDNSALAMVEPNYIQNLEDEYIEQAFAKRRTQIGWEGYYNYFTNRVDAIITFNSNQPFDYNENPNNVDGSKYDFITVAIQAIAKSLGFYMTSFFNGTNIVKLEPTSSLSKYVFGNNTSLSYQNIVNNGGKSINYAGRSWSLHCPSTYSLKFSLNYFAQDSSEVETIFMQPGISKGTAIRYIGDSVNDLFNVFNWNYSNLVVGSSSPQVHSASTGNVISYVGNNNLSSNSLQSQLRIMEESNIEDSLIWMASRREDQGPGSYVLLKDGTWEAFQTLQSLSNVIPAMQNYARTADGFLRLMFITTGYDNLYHRTYDIIDHALYKFPPQMPEFGLNSYSESNMNSSSRNLCNSRRPVSYGTREDEEYLDVEIGFEQTEGCKYILVEQIDSDWPIPYTYYIDPSEGAFIAYMTKQYPSTIKLTYINDEGQVISEPQIFDFTSEVSSTLRNVYFVQVGTKLYYEFKDIIQHENSNLFTAKKYTITKVNDGNICLKGNIRQASGYIDISSLPKGIYNILINSQGQKISQKWIKK